MEGIPEAARRIAAQAPATPGYRPEAPGVRPEFRPLQPRPTPCVAVDGSHCVLADTGALWVVAARAAAIAHAGPRVPVEPQVTAVAAQEAQATLDAAYAAWGLEAPPARSAEAFAEALRVLAEAQAAKQALESMPPGSLLLMDGALHGLPPLAQAMADRIRNAAAQRGLQVAGVSKRSGLERGGVALVPAHYATGPPSRWAVQVEPGVFVARLHALAPCAFRVDAATVAVVEAVAGHCDDAVYTGYPYPLAVAHNAVALTAGHARDLRERLAVQVRREGGAKAAAALMDFHEVLDRNVPG